MSNSEPIWRFPPNSPVLNLDEVHLWCAALDQPTRALLEFEQTLAPDERDRLEQLPTVLLRQRFIATRGLLRMILSRYLAIPPGCIKFSRSRRGKPALAQQHGGAPIEFNLSHSNSLALYAITKKHKVGVDLESLRHIDQAAIIASQFFSDRENDQLRALPAELQIEAFLSCWTRKEAYFKALGIEITECAAQVEVTLGKAARLLSIDCEKDAAARWTLHSLSPAPGYIGAVAVQNPEARLTCWQWPGNADAIFPTCCRNALRSQLN